MKNLSEKFMMLLATGFGLGYSPIASGTFGSLPGLLIVGAICSLSLPLQAAIAGALALLAVPICDFAERRFKKKDDGRIVADEYLTFPLCVLGIPWMSHPWLLGVAFVVNRMMDIIKPPPARQAQSIRGGLGIAIDDWISSLYALGVNHLIVYMLKLG